jgi:hypothetical protein
MIVPNASMQSNGEDNLRGGAPLTPRRAAAIASINFLLSSILRLLGYGAQ